jgi:hypothetical protein
VANGLFPTNWGAGEKMVFDGGVGFRPSTQPTTGWPEVPISTVTLASLDKVLEIAVADGGMTHLVATISDRDQLIPPHFFGCH